MKKQDFKALVENTVAETLDEMDLAEFGLGSIGNAVKGFVSSKPNTGTAARGGGIVSKPGTAPTSTGATSTASVDNEIQAAKMIGAETGIGNNAKGILEPVLGAYVQNPGPEQAKALELHLLAIQKQLAKILPGVSKAARLAESVNPFAKANRNKR